MPSCEKASGSAPFGTRTLGLMWQIGFEGDWKKLAKILKGYQSRPPEWAQFFFDKDIAKYCESFERKIKMRS